MTIGYFAAFCVVAWAGWTDLMSGKIKNTAALALLACGGLVVSTVAAPTWHLVAFGVVAVSAFALWATDAGIGGGDVKLLSGLALVLGPLFLAFLPALGFSAFILNRSRSLLPVAWRRRRDMIPLGTAAAPAFALTLLMGGVA